MLSKEKQEEIIQEEKFRLKIRQSLIDTPKKNKTWEFLNSNFGIWLLSSVAVGMITWGYSELSQKIALEKKNEVEINKHDLEISSRIRTYQILTSKLKQNADYFNANENLLFSAGNFYTFPEFQNLTLRTVLMEQYSLVNKNRKGEIEKAIIGIDSASRIRIQQLVGSGPETWQAPISDSLKVNAEKINKIINSTFSDNVRK